jgi:hypothetical protein
MPLVVEAEEQELAYVIPGPTGPSGTAGLAGAIGPPGLDAEDSEYPYVIPGPAGPQGPAGAGGGGALQLDQHVLSANFSITPGWAAYITRYLEIAAGFTLEIGLDGDLEIG